MEFLWILPNSLFIHCIFAFWEFSIQDCVGNAFEILKEGFEDKSIKRIEETL